MNVFRTDIHGNRIELRKGDWGGEQVLLNGKVISNRPFLGWSRASHFFDVVDETGNTRHIEIRVYDESRWGFGKHRAAISVDGEERCRLKPFDPDRKTDRCTNCGYSLVGLPVENGEVQCPECGRHTPETMLELPKNEQ